MVAADVVVGVAAVTSRQVEVVAGTWAAGAEEGARMAGVVVAAVVVVVVAAVGTEEHRTGFVVR